MIVHIMDQPELEKEVVKFAKPYNPRVVAVYGGVSKYNQFKELKAECEVVSATSGRLMDLLKMKVLRMFRATYLVLDEDIKQVVNVLPSDAEKMPWPLEKLPCMIDDRHVLVIATKKDTVHEIEKELNQSGFELQHSMETRIKLLKWRHCKSSDQAYHEECLQIQPLIAIASKEGGQDAKSSCDPRGRRYFKGKGLSCIRGIKGNMSCGRGMKGIVASILQFSPWSYFMHFNTLL
jgi:hypothetical protein